MDEVIETSDSTPRIFQGKILKEILSEHQQSKILEHELYGEMLFVDGQHQSSISDEHRYHETFVHSLMIGAAEPQTALILGGAEGCLTREILRWPTITRIVQVDWDASLVNYFRTEGRHWNGDSYSDPRLEVHCKDALSYLNETTEKFDCIFIDLFDPSEDNLNFLKDILIAAKDRLNINGCLSINAGVALRERNTACELADFMKGEFQEPQFYRTALKVLVPSQFGEWCFLMATHRLWAASATDKTIPKNLKYFSLEKFQKSIRWNEDHPNSLRWFWLRSQEEKLEVIQKLNAPQSSIETKVFEHHGC